MNREFYENMADGFTAQLKDILSSATYDQIDEFMDILEEFLVNTESDAAALKLRAHIMSIYEPRIDDIDVEVGMNLENLHLSVREKNENDDDGGELEAFSMDDFVFSL